MQIYSNGNMESLKKDVMELSKEELDYISKTIPLVDTPALFVSRNKIEIIQQMNCTEKEYEQIHYKMLYKLLNTNKSIKTQMRNFENCNKIQNHRKELWRSLPSPLVLDKEHGIDLIPITTGFQSLDELISPIYKLIDDNTNKIHLKCGIYPGMIIELLSSSSNAGKTYLCLHIICASSITNVIYSKSNNTKNDVGDGNNLKDCVMSTNMRAYVLYIDTSNAVTNGANLISILQRIAISNPSAASSGLQTQAFVEECLSLIEIQKCFTLQDLITILTNIHHGTKHYRLIVIDGLYALLAPLYSVYNPVTINSTNHMQLSASDLLNGMLVQLTQLLRNLTAVKPNPAKGKTNRDAYGMVMQPPAIIVTNVTGHDGTGQPLYKADSIGILTNKSSLKRIHSSLKHNADINYNKTDQRSGHTSTVYHKRFCIDQVHTNQTYQRNQSITNNNYSTNKIGSISSNVHRNQSNHLFQECIDMSLYCQWTNTIISNHDECDDMDGIVNTEDSSGIHIDVLSRNSIPSNAHQNMHVPHACDIRV